MELNHYDLQNITQKTKDRINRNPTKNRVEPRCSGRVAVPAPVVALIVLLVTNPVISHE